MTRPALIPPTPRPPGPAPPPEPLTPTIDDRDDDEGPRRYYIIHEWVDDCEWVPTIWARSVDAACVKWLDDRIKATLPYPPWEDHEPPDLDAPEMRLAIDVDDRRYLVGVAEWPAGERRVHGELRSTFNAAERRAFEDGWDYLEEMWPRMVGRSPSP